MSDLTPDERLAKLRALEEWLAWQLHDTRRKIAALEQQQAPVGYVVEQKIRDDHPIGATIHRADCHMIERDTRACTPDDARTALTKDPGHFTACEFCRPGRTLGLGD